MKNNKLTQLDTDQIHKLTFDESIDAQRVILVGGEKLDIQIDEQNFLNAIKDGLKLIKIDTSNKSELTVIEKNVFIPKIERIEVPTIITQIEYKEIEKPVIIEKIVTIEKPIIIKEIQQVEVIKERYYPFIIKLTAVLQTVAVLGLLLINLLKK